MSEIINLTPTQAFDEAWTFFNGSNTWLIKISHYGEIVFNKDVFPHAKADDFAKAFIEIVQKCVMEDGKLEIK